ncbi:MAG: 4-(cytidine 5'-diphospho)-2-C-methyl-D-erythritol kinase [Hyphomicrobiaceae bacterium]|nr:4-(cytidine 5'-diphospho)-2-C-methyl-D-erythritol kinase [Hyphomicrobiaceae bacterium]
MSIVVEYARPKVNLTLAIRGRRGDGYHELASLVAFASGGPTDRIELDTAAPSGIRVEGPFASAIVGENLLQRVLDRVAPHLGGRSPGTVTLDKNLPVAAGVGGGSADAAALLRALRRAFPDLATTIDWQALALSLGADVPVCLAGTTTWMTGIGETLAPVTGMPALAGVLVNPCVAVPPDKTARVFRILAAPALSNDTPITAAPRTEANPARQIAELSRFENALTAAAAQVVPQIGGVLTALADCEGCRLARLSGAGPTAFGLFDDATSAENAAVALQRSHPGWWVAATTLG